jgi:hypothetical protein
MKFYNHCTAELSNEAKKVINASDWHPTYKAQLLSRAEDMLEAGKMIHTNTGGYTIPFNIIDVAQVVTILADTILED